MIQVTAKQRVGSLLCAVLACAVALLLLPGTAVARPYTVVSCNSAWAFGFNASAWAPYSNAGSTYETCPTNGGFNAGVSNRMTRDQAPQFGGFNFSGHAFSAPPGTTITQLRWAGRIARNYCYWGTFIRALPSDATVAGVRNGQVCATQNFDGSNWPVTYDVPPGTTRLEQLVFCGALQCEPGAAMHSHVLEVTVEDPEPPSISLSGALVSGQWVSGRLGLANLDIAVTDNTGVQRIEASLSGRSVAQTYGCNWSNSVPCASRAASSSVPSVADLADGHHTLSVSANDAPGNSASESREVYVDNTPPDPVVPEISGGTEWRRSNGFDVSWANPPNNAAPITRAHWKLCSAEGTCPAKGQRTEAGVHALPGLLAPAAGEYRLHVWLEDAAGNERETNAVVSVPVRFDPEPPELVFLPLDPEDPLRIAVSASDRHSGIASGEIEMRAVGTSTWHGLATRQEGAQLVAYVDDERFRRGSYEFRAHAQDHAGNEASTGNRADGSAATLRLPARIDTRLAVGVRRRGHRKGGRLDNSVVARFGRRLRLRGRLANADGQPIEAATVEALETRSDGTVVPIGLATTGPEGRFRYALRATRNRDIAFRYAGSRRIGAATAAFRLRVRASSSIRVNRDKVRNGQAVLFTGRVASRPLPPDGKLIEMQAHFRGRWRTFSTVRTDRAGSWRFPYRFGATLGRVTYRFRARLPSEGGYPFVTGRSRVARVVVFGL